MEHGITEKLRGITSSKYEAIIVAAKKARLINLERLAKEEQLGQEAVSSKHLPKVTTEALQKLASGELKYKYLEETLADEGFFPQ